MKTLIRLREKANALEGSTIQYDIQSDQRPMDNFHHEGEIGNANYGNNIPSRDEVLQTIGKNEFNLRLSQEMDSMMSTMHSQINRANSSAISDRVIPELSSFVSSMSSSGNKDTEVSSSPNSQENREQTNGLISKISKDIRSACALRNTEDLSPYRPQRPQNDPKMPQKIKTANFLIFSVFLRFFSNFR